LDFFLRNSVNSTVHYKILKPRNNTLSFYMSVLIVVRIQMPIKVPRANSNIVLAVIAAVLCGVGLVSLISFINPVKHGGSCTYHVL
jgi:hypothetical protein